MKYEIDRHSGSGSTCAGIVFLLVLGSCGAPGTADDYLSPELRARVEQLKQEAATSPITAENLQARIIPVPPEQTPGLDSVFLSGRAPASGGAWSGSHPGSG